MYTVYVLYSEKYNRLYIGFTSDIQNRILSHNQLGKKGFTLKFRPWKLIHTEVFPSQKEAMARERQLKSGQGRKWIRENFL